MVRKKRTANSLPGVKLPETKNDPTPSPTERDRDSENEYVQEFLDKRKSGESGTFERDQAAFNKYTSFLSISPIEVEYKDVEDFADFLGENDHPKSTINNYISSIKKFHEFLNKRYQMNMPSLAGIKGSNHASVPTHERKALSRDAVKSLMDATETIRLAVIHGLLYYAGCRRGEVSNLKIHDVDTEEKRARIANSKFGKSRNVPLYENLCWLLKVWLESERETYAPARNSDYLIVTEKTEQISPKTIYRLVMKTAKKADIQEVVGTRADGSNIYKVKPHILRHSIATHAAEDEIPLEDIQTILGHSQISTTRDYIRYNERRAQRAFQSKFQGL